MAYTAATAYPATTASTASMASMAAAVYSASTPQWRHGLVGPTAVPAVWDAGAGLPPRPWATHGARVCPERLRKLPREFARGMPLGYARGAWPIHSGGVVGRHIT